MGCRNQCQELNTWSTKLCLAPQALIISRHFIITARLAVLPEFTPVIPRLVLEQLR